MPDVRRVLGPAPLQALPLRREPRVTVTRRKGGRIGVPKGTYEALCEVRGEVCWICGAAPKTRRLHIDHDHATLKVRGLLCFNCNRRLPKGTSAVWLRAAAAYVEAAYLEDRGGVDEPPAPSGVAVSSSAVAAATRHERAGWITAHPLTGEPVEVVTREWLDEALAGSRP